MLSILIVYAPSDLKLTINNGELYTTSLYVNLAVWATGATEMAFSNDGSNWSPLEPYVPIVSWALTPGPGQKTVFFQAFNDTVSSPSPTYSKITFVVPPSALSITINGGVNQTRVNNVTLSLSATGATEMCFSNDGNASSTWEPYNTE